MTNVYFEELKALLEETVCQEIQLKRPVRGDDLAFRLTKPVVSIGWPEVEITDPVLMDKVPGIAIGLGSPITDNGEKRTVPIQLACIVYSPGTHPEPGELDVSRGTGLQDLTNLIDHVVRAVRLADPVTPHLVLEDPEIQWDIDGDSHGSYWLGWVSFTLAAAPLPARGETDLL